VVERIQVSNNSESILVQHVSSGTSERRIGREQLTLRRLQVVSRRSGKRK